MSIRLVILSDDMDYMNFLSDVAEENYDGVFEINVCTETKNCVDVCTRRRPDILITESYLANEVSAVGAKVKIALCESDYMSDELAGYCCVRKYQRISGIISEILEEYAKVAPGGNKNRMGQAQIVAVWSPAGGTGKTSVAIAYAAKQNLQGKKTVYLDLENFSAVDVFFPAQAKSISHVFNALGNDSNLEILVSGLLQKDGETGVLYFGMPENYDDLNILTAPEVELILQACAGNADEIVVDLSGALDEKAKFVLDNADKIFVVLDDSESCFCKWKQFKTQHSIFGQVEGKLCLVFNKGSHRSDADVKRQIYMPNVKSGNPATVYKTLSANSFE